MAGGQRPFRLRPGTGLTFDGQSFIYSPGNGRSIAALVMDQYPGTGSVVGISGTTYATRAADAAARSWWSFRNSSYPILIDIGGQSDIFASMTAAQVLTAMEDYHADARDAGAQFTVVSTVPASLSYTAPQDAERQALNELILASTAWDAVADLDAIPESQDPSNATYYSDGLHPTAALAALFAGAIVAVLP